MHLDNPDHANGANSHSPQIELDQLGLGIGAPHLGMIGGECRRLLGAPASSVGWDGGSVPHCRVTADAGLGGCERDDAPPWLLLLLRCPGRGPPRRCSLPAGVRRGSSPRQAERRAAGPPPRQDGNRVGNARKIERSAVTPTGRTGRTARMDGGRNCWTGWAICWADGDEPQEATVCFGLNS